MIVAAAGLKTGDHDSSPHPVYINKYMFMCIYSTVHKYDINMDIGMDTDMDMEMDMD
jgi:hypothetical protein